MREQSDRLPDEHLHDIARYLRATHGRGVAKLEHKDPEKFAGHIAGCLSCLSFVERWWDYPVACHEGHRWGPGRITISWLPCTCAGGFGHLRVNCRTDGCTSPAWHMPRHVDGTEVIGRPGGADRRRWGRAGSLGLTGAQ